MRCLDTTFLIDFTRGRGPASESATRFVQEHDRLSAPAPAIAEVLMGANYRGGTELRRTLGLVELLDVLPVDLQVASVAGQIGAEMFRRGTPFLGIDLLVAATAQCHRKVLVTRDAAFSRVPGLAVESY